MAKQRATVLIGGRQHDAESYRNKIKQQVAALRKAIRPKPTRKLASGEERQLLLPGMEQK